MRASGPCASFLTGHPMLRLLFLVFACSLLLACIGANVDRLPEETRLREVTGTADLEGLYRNQGSSHSGEWHPLLSDLLFPGISFSETPDHIRLGSEEGSTLRCEAVSHGKVLAVRRLMQGEDFHVVDGAIDFDRKQVEPVVSVAGAGVGRESSTLRLTERGDAVLASKGGGVGLMLFVVPMAVSNAQEALFERIEEGKPPAGTQPVQP